MVLKPNNSEKKTNKMRLKLGEGEDMITDEESSVFSKPALKKRNKSLLTIKPRNLGDNFKFDINHQKTKMFIW